MNQKVIKHIIKEELNKSDEAKIKKLARDEFDKMIKKENFNYPTKFHRP